MDVKGSLSSNSSAVLIRMAINGSGIIRVPLRVVQKEIDDNKLDVILKNVSLSPERMSAYCARVKRLPAKTADFLSFLKTALRPQVNG